MGATYALSATIGASVATSYSPALGLLAAVALGALCGMVNGFLVTKININPFVTTLGTALVIRGLALIYSDAQPYPVDNSLFNTIGAGYLGPVPVPFLIMVGLMIVLEFVLARSAYGRGLYAVEATMRPAISRE